jgi:hypothetical protein
LKFFCTLSKRPMPRKQITCSGRKLSRCVGRCALDGSGHCRCRLPCAQAVPVSCQNGAVPGPLHTCTTGGGRPVVSGGRTTHGADGRTATRRATHRS